MQYTLQPLNVPKTIASIIKVFEKFVTTSGYVLDSSKKGGGGGEGEVLGAISLGDVYCVDTIPQSCNHKPSLEWTLNNLLVSLNWKTTSVQRLARFFTDRHPFFKIIIITDF